MRFFHCFTGLMGLLGLASKFVFMGAPIRAMGGPLLPFALLLPYTIAISHLKALNLKSFQKIDLMVPSTILN